MKNIFEKELKIIFQGSIFLPIPGGERKKDLKNREGKKCKIHVFLKEKIFGKNIQPCNFQKKMGSKGNIVHVFDINIFVR